MIVQSNINSGCNTIYCLIAFSEPKHQGPTAEIDKGDSRTP